MIRLTSRYLGALLAALVGVNALQGMGVNSDTRPVMPRTWTPRRLVTVADFTGGTKWS